MNAQEKQRIDYVDLLKGFAMVMVIAGHCELRLPDCIYEQFKLFRMPLFFFLAGMFVTGRRSTASFILKKINRIAIPGAFFSMLYLLIASTVSPYVGFRDLWVAPQESVLRPPLYFIYRLIFQTGNTYLWFIWCIFFATIIFHTIIKCTDGRPTWMRFLIITLCGVIGFMSLSKVELMATNYGIGQHIDSFMRFAHAAHIPIAFLMLPVMYAGHIAVAIGVHKWQPTYRQAIVILLISGTIGSIAVFCPHIELFLYRWTLEAYPLCLAVIIFFLTMAKLIQRVPVINYIGRYSLIALGVQFIFMVLIHYIIPMDQWPWLKFAVVLTLTLLSIYPLRRWVPWLTGYADLIRPVKPWRVFSAAKG